MEDFVRGKICPVCGKHHFEEDDNFEICPVCGWEDDGMQRDNPDYTGGANTISLNQTRDIWKKTGSAAAIGIANDRTFVGLPIYDKNGNVILDEPNK